MKSEILKFLIKILSTAAAVLIFSSEPCSQCVYPSHQQSKFDTQNSSVLFI
jgi:hypothetical protein